MQKPPPAVKTLVALWVKLQNKLIVVMAAALAIVMLLRGIMFAKMEITPLAFAQIQHQYQLTANSR